ncbi:hypothetical protein TCON_2436 [Astathelohania contejeani]|uniref:Uncharacterized protein n=1 Tax=Astathelohania contejeani TaxID=164912 RepID=A0ABQ7HW20_9MICR|nr:hypothetical protein TCON_2436 [Thelohania contejeani]
MLDKFFSFFEEKKSPKDFLRELNIAIRKQKLVSAKLTAEINTMLATLQKQILRNNSEEVKRTSRVIVLAQRRRKKNDDRVESLENIRDTVMDAQCGLMENVSEAVKILENQSKNMLKRTSDLKKFDEVKNRIEVLTESLTEEVDDEDEIGKEAETLVHKTSVECGAIKDKL